MTLDFFMDQKMPEGITPNDIEPPYKWCGGKRKQIPKLLSLLPKNIEDHYEPFAGGAALGLYLKANGYINGKLILGDTCQIVILTLKVIRDHPEELMETLSNERFFAKTEERYYQLRTIFNEWTSNDITQTAIFLYLNRMCVNGLYRENASGKFNVSYRKLPPKWFFKIPTILGVSYILQDAIIIQQDFQKTISTAKKGDTVYLDPPYWQTFTSYGYWNPIEDHHRIKESAVELTHKEVNCIISNIDHSDITKLFKKHPESTDNIDFSITRLKTSCSMNTDGSNRTQSEIIITNS